MENLNKTANNLFIYKQYYLAIEIYNYLLNKQYKSSIMYSNKSACYLYIKDYKKALYYALLSVQLDLNNSIAWGRIGYSYKGLKMFSESLNAFEIAHKFNKNNNNYLKELIFLHDRFNKKININNIFNLLLNNNILFNKIKENKNNIINNCLDNNNNIINEILNKL
jgi:tetratricopeptide (TPR) repeat protein